MNKYIAWTPLALFVSGYALAAPVGQDAISRGEYLARAGDCVACHTSDPAQPFAGGLKMSTPVGAIYSTNITPDKQTGIGNYRYEDFVKAVRQGINKSGDSLYPAMPYPSFAKISDQDMQDLYQYFMKGVKPVVQQNKASDIPWPLSMRWPLGLWRRMFADDNRYQPVEGKSAQWQRGAYLVQGLGHCGACHTPRGMAYQEKAADQTGSAWLTGSALDGWYAPDLTGSQSEGLGRWSAQELSDYLKNGVNDHSSAFGPMSEVVSHSLSYLNKQDVDAIAEYLKSLPASHGDTTTPPAPISDNSTAQALFKGDVSARGAADYLNNCSACHRSDGKGYDKTFPALAGNSALLSDDPSSVIHIILQGGQRTVTAQMPTGLTMPDFGWRLSDQQVADVATFIRQGWGNHASAVTPQQVAAIRKNLPPQTISAKPQ